MNNYYQKNLDAIKSNSNAFPMSVFSNLENSNILDYVECVETKNKKLSAKITYQNKTFNLHSLYDPINESKKLATSILEDSEVNIVFLFGMAAGYLHQAIRNINYDINIAIIEPSYDMFFTMMSIFPLDKVLKDSNTMFFIGENQIGDIETFISLSPTKKLKLATNRAYANIFYSEAVMYNEKIFDSIDKKSININTMGKFEKLWAYNISANVARIAFHYGVNKFFDKFSRLTCIVVSAGPSLEKNIAKIKSVENKAIIIAVDTAIKPLSYHNIAPHFIVTIDPQKKNSKYFRYQNTDKSVLIAESSIDREVLDNHHGALYFSDSIFPLSKLFMKYLGERGELSIGGSVSTAAFDFAIRAGFKQIIMLGLDLSFPDHQTHIRGSYHEEDFFTQISRLDTYDSRIYEVLVEGNLKSEKNIYAQTVYIDSRFQMYRAWYENHIEANKNVKVYNATEGGVNIAGMENITFDEVCSRLLTDDIDLSFIDFSYSASCVGAEKKIEITKSIKKELDSIISDIKNISPTIESAIEISEKLVADVKRHRNVDKILMELDKLDKKIFNFTSLSPFISLTMQKTIKLITEGYDLADESIEDKNIKNALNSSLLYKEIKKSIEFNVFVIERAISNLS